MRTIEKMREDVANDRYILSIEIDEFDGSLNTYLYKHKGEVKITPKRALQWVEAGIESFEGYTKDEMVEMLS